MATATEDITEAPERPDEKTTKKLVDRFLLVRGEMKEELVERGTEIDLMLQAVIARAHLILLGEAGVAKSMLVDTFFSHVSDVRIASYLLNKNTLSDEVFGTPSMKGLKNDEFYFVTEGEAPEAHLLFWDEIFKCNSTILNGALGLINERKFKNGTRGMQQSPLWTCVGASNELPTHDREDLMAFRDRFAITKIVQPVRSQDGLMQIIEGQLARNRGEKIASDHTCLTREEVETLQTAAKFIGVPNKVQRALADLRMRAENEGITLSARRMFEGLRLCQANALLSGRGEVRTEDLRIFEHVMWNDPDDIATATGLTIDFAGQVGRRAAQLRTEYEEAAQKFADAQRQMPSGDESIPEAVLDELTKVSAIITRVNKRVDEAISEANDNAWDPSELETVKAEVKRTRQSVRSLIGIGD